MKNKKLQIQDAKDITDRKGINVAICKFCKNLFKKNVSKSDSERDSFLNSITLPSLNSKNFDMCQSEITEKDLITALKSMPKGKSLRHDGSTKEFYEYFWVDLKIYYIKYNKSIVLFYHVFSL